jgi:nucleotide-binding universal stress UspA family protein
MSLTGMRARTISGATMLETIYVAVDNSDHSNAAIRLGITLGKAFGAKMVGSHIYAAKLHDVRFKQMEFTLPDEYKEEAELEKQRKIHDALIGRGLQLISDSYLEVMQKTCADEGLAFEPKIFDGRTFEELVKDIEQSDYDLVVLGALGQGAVKHSEAGSVAERVLRRTSTSTLVVRDCEATALSGDGAIGVAFDGSPDARAALDTACFLAQKSGRRVEIVAAEKPGTVEEALLDAHLQVAKQLARAYGVQVRTTTLEGAAGPALVAWAAQTKPWLVVAGRQGADAEEGDGEIGSVTEHLVRRSPAHTLIVAKTERRRAEDRPVTEARA